MVSPRQFQRQNDRILHQVSKGENVIVKYRGNQCIFRSESGIEQLSTFYTYDNAFFSRKYEVLPEVIAYFACILSIAFGADITMDGRLFPDLATFGGRQCCATC